MLVPGLVPSVKQPMREDTVTDVSNGDAEWLSYARRVGHLSSRHRALFPDFLVVAPPKTGTSWLAVNLRHHPGFVIPAEKEVRYFDFLWRRRSLEWYCRQFARRSGQLAGDISPNYALLPSFAIHHIRSLKPDLKIVILLREPIQRAWSHLKHTFLHREANFAGDADGRAARSIDNFAELAQAAMIRNLVDDYTLSCGDYQAIVRRWFACFPRDQIHIAFLEEIAADPKREILRLAKFLGATPFDGFGERQLGAIVNHGLPGDIPATLRPLLLKIFQARRRRFERFLDRVFGLRTPWHTLDHDRLPVPRRLWSYRMDEILGWPIELRNGWFQLCRHALSDHPPFRGAPRALFVGDLRAVLSRRQGHQPRWLQRFSIEDMRLTSELDRLASTNTEAVMPPTCVESDHYFRFVHWRGRYFAIRKSLGMVDVRLGVKELQRCYASNDLAIGTSLEEVRRAVWAGGSRLLISFVVGKVARCIPPSLLDTTARYRRRAHQR